MSEERRKSDYLWDGQGEPDPEVQRLERLLSPFRHDPGVVSLAARRTRTRRTWVVASAALVVAAAAVTLILWPRDGRQVAGGLPADAGPTRVANAGWAVKRLHGAPTCQGEPIGQSDRLPVGEWLTTDGASSAEIAVADIGSVRIDPGTRVRLVATGAEEHRMELLEGRIHVDVTAPPRLFVVDTPSATAIDLGCAYELRVDPSGDGELQVTSGWVALASRTIESVVPAGARCSLHAGNDPGIPWFTDAAPELVAALREIEEGRPPGHTVALERVLASTSVRDTLSLWHVVPRVDGDLRASVVDRILALVPGLPGGITRAAVLAADPGAMIEWRHKLASAWGLPPPGNGKPDQPVPVPP